MVSRRYGIYVCLVSLEGAVRGVNPSVDGVLSKKSYKDKKLSSCAPQNDTCTRCGKSLSHPCQYCSAKEATCFKCKKKRHCQTLCKLKKKIDSVVNDTQEEEDNFLGAVHASDGKA